MLHGEPEYRRRRRQEAEENLRYADREWDEATKERNREHMIAAIKSVEKKLDRAVDERASKNKADRRRHWAEIFGLWAAAFVGAVAIVVGNHDASGQREAMDRQLRTMQRQLDESVQQRRPWLKGDFAVDSLTITDKGLQIGIMATIENIGHSPARHFFVSTQLVPWDLYAAISSEEQLCSSTKNAWSNVKKWDSVIFPNASQHTLEITFESIDDIREYMRNKRPTMPLDKPSVEFSIVGCISYEFDGSDEIHQTGFILSLGRKDSKNMFAFVDFSNNGSFDVSNLYLGQYTLGAFAN